MKFDYFVYVLSLVLFLSCSDSSQKTKPNQDKVAKKVSPDKKPPSGFEDTLKVNFPAAIFYSPDSLQLEQIRSLTDPGVFNGITHEDFYLMRNAHNVLKKYYPGLAVIDAKKVRYLFFIKDDGNGDCIDLDAEKDPYGLFIFNRKKSPERVDMANIDTELRFYFSK